MLYILNLGTEQKFLALVITEEFAKELRQRMFVSPDEKKQCGKNVLRAKHLIIAA